MLRRQRMIPSFLLFLPLRVAECTGQLRRREMAARSPLKGLRNSDL